MRGECETHCEWKAIAQRACQAARSIGTTEGRHEDSGGRDIAVRATQDHSYEAATNSVGYSPTKLLSQTRHPSPSS